MPRSMPGPLGLLTDIRLAYVTWQHYCGLSARYYKATLVTDRYGEFHELLSGLLRQQELQRDVQLYPQQVRGRLLQPGANVI